MKWAWMSWKHCHRNSDENDCKYCFTNQTNESTQQRKFHQMWKSVQIQMRAQTKWDFKLFMWNEIFTHFNNENPDQKKMIPTPSEAHYLKYENMGYEKLKRLKWNQTSRCFVNLSQMYVKSVRIKTSPLNWMAFGCLLLIRVNGG